MSALMLTSLTVARPSVRSRLSSARSGKPVRAAVKHVPACASLKTETVQASVASALFATLATCESAQAAKELVQLADNRPLVLLGLGLPVLGWVAFNIAQPALRQLDSMTGAEAPKKGPTKRRSAAAALTGLTAGALLAAPEQADAAQELLQLADNRPLVLLGLGLPVLGWVAFNIAQPALRQLDSMTGAEAPKKGPTKRRSVAAALTGLTAGALLAAPESAQAASELMQVADNRPLVLLGLGLPVLGWVAFNIAQPAFRQLEGMTGKEAPKKAAPKRR